eukprot:Clim_evm4s177 gene=Clim_evmTU4s177
MATASVYMVLLAIFVVLGTYYVATKTRFTYVSGITRIPSSWPLGSLPEIAAANQKGKAHQWFMKAIEMHSNGEDLLQFKVVLNGTGVICKDPMLVREVLKQINGEGSVLRTKGLKKSFVLLSNGLLVLESDVWRQHRRAVLPAFNTSRLKQVCELTSGVGSGLVEQFREIMEQNAAAGKNGPTTVDVHYHCNVAALQVLFEALFGLEKEAIRETLKDYYERVDVVAHGIVKRFDVPQPFWGFLSDADEFKEALHYLKKDMMDKIEARADEPTTGSMDDEKDVLSLLLRAGERENMTLEEVMDEALMFFGAGHETTANSMTWTLFELAQRPDLQQKIRQELNEVLGEGFDEIPYESLDKLILLDAVMKESLRLHPVAPFVGRQVAENGFQLGKYQIPFGSEIIVPIGYIQTDPKNWDDPKTFKPSRWLDKDFTPKPGTYLPFSSGPQNCIGERLAKLEMRVVVAKLLQAFEFTLAKKPSEYEEIFTITLGLKKGAPMFLRPVQENPSSRGA